MKTRNGNHTVKLDKQGIGGSWWNIIIHPDLFFMVELLQGIFALCRWESFPPIFFLCFFLVWMCITKTSCNMGMLLDTSNTFSVPSCVLLYFESRSHGFECPPWVLNFVSGCILLPVSSTWSQCLLRSLSSCDLDWMEHYQEQLHLRWDAGSRWMFYFNFLFHPAPILREMIQFDYYVFKTGFSTESSEHWKICIPTTSVILSNWSM